MPFQVDGPPLNPDMVSRYRGTRSADRRTQCSRSRWIASAPRRSEWAAASRGASGCAMVIRSSGRRVHACLGGVWLYWHTTTSKGPRTPHLCAWRDTRTVDAGAAGGRRSRACATRARLRIRRHQHREAGAGRAPVRRRFFGLCLCWPPRRGETQLAGRGGSDHREGYRSWAGAPHRPRERRDRRTPVGRRDPRGLEDMDDGRSIDTGCTAASAGATATRQV